MKETTYNFLVKNELDIQDFENLENILGNYMIYNQDEMIIKIMEFYNKK